MRMTCAATDGCAAMTAALAKEAPHTSQQRCVWHLQQNIIKHTGGSGHQLVIRAWYACVHAGSVSDFEARWADLQRVKMSEKCSEYLTKYILPLRAKWAVHATGQLTNFGSHSTQLVESLNRLLKMWDVNDRTSLSRAVERICTVKEEEETRRQIAEIKDHSMRTILANSAGHTQTHNTYKTQVRNLLTGAAALLCEEQYDLFSQYRVAPHHPTQGLFTLATQVYIITHKTKQPPSQHQVHVSTHLIYCPCGFFTAYLLPCRHVLAANGSAFADVFQAGQYHPRWRLQYSEAVQRELLSKQFWLNVGHEVTSEGLMRVQCKVAQGSQEAEGGGAARASSVSTPASEAAAAAAAAEEMSRAQLLMPTPMYPPALLELHPALVSPQQLFHMIEGECASLRQLACTNPAKLSGLVWTELHQAKLRITQHIDREQRMQQRLHISAAAAASGDLTSEGVPLASLLAPVPLTVSKQGRPSSKRSRAAVGHVARRVRAMLPVSQRERTASELEQQEETAAGVSDGARRPMTLCSAAVASAAAAASRADCGYQSDAAAAAAVSSSTATAACTAVGVVAAGSAAAASAAAAVAVAPLVSGRGRPLVRRAPFE
jgi:hypothetical protein